MVASLFLVGILIYAAGINALTYALFAIDKHRAQVGGRRIPERRLLACALAGGSIGAVLAQQRLRHKTRKQPFRAQLSAILGVQILAAVGILALRLAGIPGF